MPDTIHNSTTLVLRDLTSGAARSGLVVKLRDYSDDFATDKYTGTEIVGKPGVYEFIDIPFSKYKLWVNSVEDKSFGGTYGVWYPTDNVFALAEFVAEQIKSGTFDSARIPNLDAGKITSGTLAHARIPYTIDALKIGSGVVGNPNWANLAFLREKVQSRLDNIPALVANSVVVDPDAYTGTGSVKFATIQSAINYCQSLTPAPSASNKYFIFILPNKNNGYVENLTLQPYINLVGIGTPLIRGTLSSGSMNTSLYNLYVEYEGNASYSYIKAFNSYLTVKNPGDTGYSSTFDHCKLVHCMLLNYASTAEFNPRIISAGNNAFLLCVSNIKIDLLASDIGSVNSLESLGFFL